MFPKLLLLLGALAATTSAASVPRRARAVAVRAALTESPDTIDPNVACNAEDDDGTPLIASGVGDDEKQFSWCEYEAAGLCTYFATDGSFSSGSSNCPEGLTQDAAVFGVNDNANADAEPSKVKVVVVTVTVPADAAAATETAAEIKPVTDPALDPAPAPQQVTDPALDPAPVQITDPALDPAPAALLVVHDDHIHVQGRGYYDSGAVATRSNGAVICMLLGLVTVAAML
ncbi:hypothetical protein MKEN_00963200 [Mycena kentingensis (nom. inval.)]|nr:hypothetical protein MKEN_00963200 [Mycena kentingensis (nom. inval.)]